MKMTEEQIRQELERQIARLAEGLPLDVDEQTYRLIRQGLRDQQEVWHEENAFHSIPAQAEIYKHDKLFKL